MNFVMISGYLSQEPKMTKAINGRSRTEIVVAARDRRLPKDANGEPRVNFIRCIVWGKQAEIVAEHTVKGMFVEIQGHVEVVFNKEVERTYTNIVADIVDFYHTEKTRMRKKEKEEQKKHTVVTNNNEPTEDDVDTNDAFTQTKETPVKEVKQNNQRKFEVDFNNVNEDNLPF